ncbi:MAG: hypothetical protein Q8L88_13880 [Bacteroidota bacterium]|nr:hypothetical protein [Bacteroidota bacterium]
MKYLLSLLAVMLFIGGCEKTSSPISNNPPTSTGALYFSFDKVNAPAAVKTLTTILSRLGYTTIEKTINIATDTSASILFEQVAIGTWKIKVDAKDENEKVLYTGQSEVIVLENSVSQVNLVLTPVSSGVGSVQINVTWGQTVSGWYDYENNAVLSKSSSSYENIGVSQPRVYKINNQYYMYYQMIGAISSIGLALSSDGTNWEKYGSVPVLQADSLLWDRGGVVTGPIIFIDGIYIMYYHAYAPSIGTHAVGITKSIDGKSWTKPSGNLIMVNGNYVYHASEVIKKDGKYLLYYVADDNTTGKRAIYLAESENGISWAKVQNDPVLKSSLEWENSGVVFSTIIFEDGIYKAVYSDNGYSTSNFGFATSIDGKTWKKELLPIFTYKNTINNWANAGISYPFLVKVGTQKRIYYMGAVGSNYERRIGFAYMK